MDISGSYFCILLNNYCFFAHSFSSKGELIAGHEENTMEGYYKPCFIQKPPPDTTAEEGKLVRFDVKVCIFHF